MTVQPEQGGPEGEGPIELFVPGRLCLFGEHSDWAGAYRKHNPGLHPGRTIVVGTEQGLYARARRLGRPALVLRSTRDDGREESVELPLDAESLAEVAARGGFWAYAAGVAYKLLVEFGVGGLELHNYRTTLPLKKGLSSSAAFCVLVARAFNRLYRLQLTTRGEMQVAYEGERLTPSQCGKMDQGCAFGQVPVLMTYDGDLLHVAPARLGGPMHLVLVDLRAGKDTVEILRALQEAFPHPQGPQQESLVELLGPINERITAEALAAMGAGDATRLGALMSEAQREFDARAAPLCPAQLASPVLHSVLAHPPIQQHILGGKGVGSQGDGTAQLLCRDAAAQTAVCAILQQDLGVQCMPFTVPPTASTEGGGQPAEPTAAAAQQHTSTNSTGLRAARAKDSAAELEAQQAQQAQQAGAESKRGAAGGGAAVEITAAANGAALDAAATASQEEGAAAGAAGNELQRQQQRLLEEVAARRYEVQAAQLALAAAEKALRALAHSTGEGAELL